MRRKLNQGLVSLPNPPEAPKPPAGRRLYSVKWPTIIGYTLVYYIHHGMRNEKTFIVGRIGSPPDGVGRRNVTTAFESDSRLKCVEYIMRQVTEYTEEGGKSEDITWVYQPEPSA